MKFIMVLILMLSATFGTLVTVDNIQEFLPSEHSKVADYISDNLDLFKDKYAEVEDESATVVDSSEENSPEFLEDERAPFAASSVEYRTEVTLTDGGAATYLDFDGDNGYMLIEDDYVLTKFETSGDMAWARDAATLYYNSVDGFLIDVDGELLPGDAYANYLATKDAPEDDTPTGYYGQYNETLHGGYSKIYDGKLYLDDRYNGNYKPVTRVGIKGYNTYHTQDMFTGYLGKEKMEGNCIVTAVYNAMYWYKSRGFNSINTSYENYGFSNDKFYYSAKREGYTALKSRSLPVAYGQIRDAALDNGYGVRGLPSNKVDAFLRSCNDNLPYKLSYNKPFIPTMSFITSNINKNVPVLMVLDDRRTYDGQHAVLAHEYRYYESVKKVWFFTVKDRKNMVVVAEGSPIKNIATSLRLVDYDGYMKSTMFPVMKMYALKMA